VVANIPLLNFEPVTESSGSFYEPTNIKSSLCVAIFHSRKEGASHTSKVILGVLPHQHEKRGKGKAEMV